MKMQNLMQCGFQRPKKPSELPGRSINYTLSNIERHS